MPVIGAHRRKRLLVLACIATSHVASADPTAADVKAAKQHLEAGKRLIEKQQKYDEGIREIEAAYDLDPQPVHVYNLGVAHHLRGDETAAIEYYRLFLLDPGPAKETRDASSYLAALQKKQAEARAEKTRSDLAAAQAQAAQSGSTSGTEVLLYAQYVADAEANERRIALIEDEMKAEDAEIAKAKTLAEIAHRDTAASMTLAQRWERHARLAPSGAGRGRRIFGTFLLGVGTAAVTMGVHDILTREAHVDITDNADIFIGAGTGALLVGLAFVVWGESASGEPRPPSSFEGMQLVPTLGREGGGVSLSARF
jgi:tetratricopeptide (TPR) repeat protein